MYALLDFMENFNRWRRKRLVPGLRMAHHQRKCISNVQDRAHGQVKSVIVYSIKNVFIAVMGVTGSGKISFISLCTKQPTSKDEYGLVIRKIPFALHSRLSDMKADPKGVEISSFMWNNHICVHMIYVPGFKDTNRSEGEVFLDIAGWMTIAYEKKMYLSGIIYLYRITDNCLRGVSWQDLKFFEEFCGSKCFSEVTLVSTMWDKLDSASTGVAREDVLTANEGFWGSMVKHGSRVERHSNSRDSAMSIVDSIVEHQRTVVLEIQDVDSEQATSSR
jgi:hypothetical protein